ncbi:OsmC family protein [Sandarakinorhabdus rubra]|uniref:OsmC family protein n=1 Tax=Sandarakinorhabdus rubra TaxID=2672568 RepID=UPI0013DB7C91|nr:OsmC family protein [Sandarakinorhabdus rubra]
MANPTKAQVADLQGRALAVAVAVSGHQLVADEPIEQGGANIGPTPFDLLTASLGACTAMTVRWYAGRQGWPLVHVNVEVSHRRVLRAGAAEPTHVFTKQVVIDAPALTDEQRARLHEVAEKCPVQRALTGEIEVETI